MQAPTLTTERLTLRPMRAGDFPAYAALMASPRAVYMGGPYDTAPRQDPEDCVFRHHRSAA